jgi:hypothetical protein
MGYGSNLTHAKYKVRGVNSMPGRSPVQLPDELKADLEAFRIKLAGDTGRIPANHEVIRAAMTVADAHYRETITALTKAREAELS